MRLFRSGLLILVLILVLAVYLGGCQGTSVSLDDHGQVADFALTERSGRTVRRDDLAGKVWIAAFIFTNCKGHCLQISATMAELQKDKDFAKWHNVRLVSFSVDPETDTPAVLREYADRYGADPERWLFLTGKQDEMYRLIQESFHLPVEQNQGTARRPGNEVLHSPRLALVDRRGHVRGYFDGRKVDDEGHEVKEAEKLKQAVGVLLRETP